MDAIQLSVSLIHIYIIHNRGPRSKTIPSEADDTSKSMVRWLILTRTNDYTGAVHGGDFAMTMPYGAVLMYLQDL